MALGLSGLEMNERMKIMIPYDGSINTEIALRALARRADYSQVEHDALVVVSDVWLADSAEEFARVSHARRRKAALAGAVSHAPALIAWEDERALSREASDRIASTFPSWNVQVEALPGFSLVSSEILEKAERSNTDIIAIGTRKPFSDMASGYGAAALRVAKEAPCSMFLASDNASSRSSGSGPYMPTRLALVLNGSISDEHIVHAVASRKLTNKSQVRIILGEANRSSRLEKALRASGVDVSIASPESNSTSALTDAIFDWQPDAIFVSDEEIDRDGPHNVTDVLLKAGYSVELIRKSHSRSIAMKAAA